MLAETMAALKAVAMVAEMVDWTVVRTAAWLDVMRVDSRAALSARQLAVAMVEMTVALKAVQ